MENKTCDWPDCDNPAICRSENTNGAFVCSDHLKLINVKTTEQYTDTEVAAIVRMWLIAEQRKASEIRAGGVDAAAQQLLRTSFRGKAICLLVVDQMDGAMKFSTNINRHALKRLLMNTAISLDTQPELFAKNIPVG